MFREDELLEAMARGEEFALEILFERHYEPVWKYAMTLLRDAEEAGEVVNETFFRIFTFAADFQGRGAFSAWLIRITRNLCFDYLRKRKTRLKVMEEVSSAPPVSAHCDPLWEKVACELDFLKDEYREIILLKDIAGYRIEEIAGILDKSVPAVKTLHHRAIGRLRERLAEKEAS